MGAPPPPPLAGTDPILVDFWASVPLDMTRKRASGSTPGEMKREKTRGDLMKRGIVQKSHTTSALVHIHILVYSTFSFTSTPCVRGLQWGRPRLPLDFDRLESHKTNRTPSAMATSRAKDRDNSARYGSEDDISWENTSSRASICAPIRFASQPHRSRTTLQPRNHRY